MHAILLVLTWSLYAGIPGLQGTDRAQGGRAQSHGIRGNAEAQLDKEVRPGATEHVVAPEPNSVGRRGPGLQNT
jgi:hypothetical protein